MYRAKNKLDQLLIMLICFSVMPTLTQPMHAQTLSDETFIPVVTPQKMVEDEYRLAASFYSRGQWDETVSSFKALINRFPKTDQAATGHFFLGEALMQKGNYGEAYNAYQVFLQRLPQHLFVPRATFRMGEAAYRIDNVSSAIRMLEIYVKANPHDALNEYALPYLGEIRLKREEPQLAQKAYETALRLYPDGALSNKCRLGLAKAFQMQGAEDQALRFYEFLAEPNNPLAGEAELQIGIIQFSADDVASAQLHLLSALPKCEGTISQAKAAYWLARTYVAEENYERAFELFQSVMDYEVDEQLAAALHFDGAVAATKVGKTEISNEWLAKLRLHYPENELADDALHFQIELSQKNDSPEETEILEQLFIHEYPNSLLKPSVLESAGRTYYTKKEYAKSIEMFKQLLADDLHVRDANKLTDRANWYYLKGLGHLGLTEFANAEAAFALVDTLVETEQMKPLLQIARATARFGLKNYEAAIPNYRSYLQLAADGSEAQRARTELTVALAECGRWNEVIGAFEVLRFRHAKQSIVLDTAEYLADKANKENQKLHASRWYEVMAEAGNPLDTIARGLTGLAWIKMESNEPASAMAFFERLLQECPDSRFACEAAMSRAKYLDDQQEFQQSAQMYGLVIRQFGSNKMSQVARLRRANALQKSGVEADLQESKTLLTEYLQLPDNTPMKDEALYLLAWVNQDLGLISERNDKFRELMLQYPKSKYWADAAYRMAQLQIEQKQFDEAQVLINDLISRTDIPVEIVSRALYLNGEIAATGDHWETVSQSMSDLLKRADDPRLIAKANYWLSESLYRQQQFAPAIEIFQRLHTDGTGLEETLQPWIWLRLAQCLGHQDRWDEALKVADTGKTKFARFQADYEFDFVRARGLEAAGRLTDCRSVYQLVVDSPRGGETETAAISQWRIGETFFHQEKYAAAIQEYYKVDALFSQAKWRSAALVQAGKCQEHLNNWKHAVKLYKQLIEQFPESEHAATAKQRLDRVALLANLQSETESR